MSYAVLHVDKISGSCTAITRHIERSSQPDNAHPELAHLNRSDFIRYPEGVTTLNEAIRYRIDHAGLTRKVGKNQVLALAVLLTSDGEAFDRFQKEGSFESWVQTSVEWVKKRFGEENVVAAHLHMDEQTPHLHVTVVPIVTTERKRKASEANVKKRYRTKPKGAARLCANDIMTRETLERLQDEYADEMEPFGLERGIRGSEARHVSQHEYYRDCMVKKKGLEKDVAELSTEKKKLDKEKKSLEGKVSHLECQTIALDARKKRLTEVAEEIRQANSELYSEYSRLTDANSSLTAENKSLMVTSSKLSDDVARLQMQKLSNEANGDFQKYKADIARYFPDLEDLLNWGRYCTHIGFPDRFTQRILAQEKVGFAGSLFSSEHNQTFSTEGSYAQLERDPKEKHRFILTIDGINVFQWFRDMARKLLGKLGFQPKEPRQSRGIKR